MDFPAIPSGLEYSRDCVDPSGWGVKATRRWTANEYIGPFEGITMSKKDFVTQYGKDNSYTYYTAQNFPTSKVIVAKEQRNFIGYINEALNNNVKLKGYKLWATRDIEVGDELFLRYDEFYIRNYELR